MAEKKITKVEKFDMLLALGDVQANEMLVEFLTNEKELTIKKNSYKSTNSKKTSENEALMKELETVFIDNPTLMMNCTDVVRHLNFKYSTQKIARPLNTMVENGILKATIDKKVKYFSLV